MDVFFAKTYQKNYLFYYLTNQGICVKECLGNRLEETSILMKDGQSDFDLLVDQDGQIHIVSQDQNGLVYYLKKQGTTYLKHLILHNKNQPYTEKYFKLVESGEFLNIFFILKTAEHSLLSWLKIGSSIHEPEAIDHILYGRNTFDVHADEFGNIHLCYLNEDRTLTYRIYQWSQKQWIKSQIISDSECTYPTFFLRENSLYLFYVDVKTNTLKRCDLSGDTASIFTPFIPLSAPVIFGTDEKITIQWEQDRSFYAINILKNQNVTTPSRLQRPVRNTFIRSHLRFYTYPNLFFGSGCFGQMNERELVLFANHPDLMTVINVHLKEIQNDEQKNQTKAEQSNHESSFLKQQSTEIDKVKIVVKMLSDDIIKMKQSISELTNKISLITEPKKVIETKVITLSDHQEEPLTNLELSHVAQTDETLPDKIDPIEMAYSDD